MTYELAHYDDACPGEWVLALSFFGRVLKCNVCDCQWTYTREHKDAAERENQAGQWLADLTRQGAAQLERERREAA